MKNTSVFIVNCTSNASPRALSSSMTIYEAMEIVLLKVSGVVLKQSWLLLPG